MAYFPHSADDKAAHAKYHNYTTSAIRLRVGITRVGLTEKLILTYFFFFQESQTSTYFTTISRWKYLYDWVHITSCRTKESRTYSRTGR